jgi:hypothetical protein
MLGRKEAPMNTTPDPAVVEPKHPAVVEPNNAVAAAADERLKHAYRQIASADEQLARLTEQLSKLERDAAHTPSPVPGRRPSRGRPALRGFTGLLLAACIVGAAFVYQSSWGDATRLMIARWLPSVLASSAPLEQPGLHAVSSPVQLAAAEATAVPASSPVPVPPQDVALPAAPQPPELTQQLQTITQDIANLDQKIEQLKAAQEQLVVQMASNNARAIGEFKAGQEQIMRLMAKTSEPNTRPKTSSSAPSARPVAVAPHQLTSTQARSLPSAAVRSPRQDQ